MRLIDADDFGNRMYHEAFEKDTDMQRWDSGCWIRYKLFENVLREQPTVQPDNQINLCDSCDYLYPDCPAKNDDVSFGNGIGNDNICACNKYLPSAQPEQRCINCGRTVNNGGWYEDGRTRCPIEEHYALPKDGYCHLWKKKKVWEDDYVKRPEGGER